MVTNLQAKVSNNLVLRWYATRNKEIEYQLREWATAQFLRCSCNTHKAGDCQHNQFHSRQVSLHVEARKRVPYQASSTRKHIWTDAVNECRNEMTEGGYIEKNNTMECEPASAD